MRTRVASAIRLGLLIAALAFHAPASFADELSSLSFVIGAATEKAKLCGMATDSLTWAFLQFLSAHKQTPDLMTSWGNGMNAAEETFRPVDDCPTARAEIRCWEMKLRAMEATASSPPGYEGIKHGKQMAQACFKKPTVSDQHYCLGDVLKTKLDDASNIGFTYLVFLIDGRAEEITRDNPKHPANLKAVDRSNVKAQFDSLQYLEAKLHLTTADLCEITDTNCDIAQRLERYWRDQK